MTRISGPGERTLSEAEIARAQAFESGTIRSNDIGIERFGCGNQPGIVLTHSPRRAALQESGAISTNILDLRARVLVISGGKGLILDTVLPVHWSDVRSLVLPAVAYRRAGP